MTPQQEDQLIKQAQIIGEAPKMTQADADKVLSAIPINKIIAEAKPKMENAILESMANERAAKEPLPQSAKFVFNREPLIVETSIGKVTIRPMVSYDVNIFQIIDSPIYKMILGDSPETTNANQLFTSQEEAYELIYQFTHPCKDTYNLFKQNKMAFKDKVMEEVAFIYSLDDSTKLLNAIMEHIFNVNIARTSFDVSEEEQSAAGGDHKKKLTSPPTTLTNTSS